MGAESLAALEGFEFGRDDLEEILQSNTEYQL